ncbi:hypothetical protein DUNSADRAFT_18489 [Dunaliella salina]|uniref:Protein kinase domain-containing protein n=1 Tax=Dunaliella salina TaxID=3046 RepID=A0ABQ7GYZ1_DUNSA|nr:hypothetical protein DUNSADRAFT_18489 [Dunaliella salina]|eukprot:KAF5839827.1 hypothetical protein DUNSADRAFT_18489 [Dunaliella salina]
MRCFGSCFGRSSGKNHVEGKPSHAAQASVPYTTLEHKAGSQGPIASSSKPSAEACNYVPHEGVRDTAPQQQAPPGTTAPAPLPASTALSPFRVPPPEQAATAPKSASSSGSKENSEDGTTAITSSSSSSDCISMDHGSSTGFNMAAQVGQFITQFDSLSQLLGVQEQVKDAEDMQIPGQLLLVVLELFLKLDAKAAEAAVHSLEASEDTDCIYDAFRSSISELCTMPTPPGSCSESPLPGAAPPTPPAAALQQDNQPQHHTQSASCGQLHSSGITTTLKMRHANGRAGHAAAAFSVQAQAQDADSLAAAKGAAHNASASSDAAAAGICHADTRSNSNGGGSKSKEDSLPGLFERQSQGAQQHNIEIWERFSQVRTSQIQQSQQLGRFSSMFPSGVSPTASALRKKSLPIPERESSLPMPPDQMLTRASMRLSPDRGPYLSALTNPFSGASDSSIPPAPVQHHSSAATTMNLSTSTSPPVAPHSPGAELFQHSHSLSHRPVRPRTNLLLEPRHLPYGREGPPWPGDCVWCQKHAAQQQQQQHKRHGSMSSAPMLRVQDHVTQQRPSQQGGLRSCLVHAQLDPLAPLGNPMNHSQGGGHMTNTSPAQHSQEGGRMTYIPPIHPQHIPANPAHAERHHTHSTSRGGAGLGDAAALQHISWPVHQPDSPAPVARRPSLKYVQFSTSTTSHFSKSATQLDVPNSNHTPVSSLLRASSTSQSQLSTQQQQAPHAPSQSSLAHSCAAPAAHQQRSLAHSSPQLAVDSALALEAAQAQREPLGLSAPCLWRWWWWWGLADFELTGHLHSGKSSEVVQGTCKRSGTPCVIKAYSLMRMSESERVHLHREITLQRRLDHPSITQLYCAFVEQGMFAPGSDTRFTHVSLVLEHAPGGNLAKYLKERGGQLPEAEAVELVMRPLLTALQFIHEQGIVHRDIKPENLLLDADKRLKVADFGLAVDADVGQHTFAGTLSYMSPELYSVMPKALNRSATTVSRLKHTVTATDLECSDSESEECAQEARGGVSKLSPVPSPYVSSAHASSAAYTQELAGCSSAGPCGDGGAGDEGGGFPSEPALAKPYAHEKASSNPCSLSRRRHSEGSESVRTSRTSRTSHASKASHISRASRRSADTSRSLLQQHPALIPEHKQQQGSDGVAATTTAGLSSNRRASMPLSSVTPLAGTGSEGSRPPISGAGLTSSASSTPFNAAAAAAAAAARRPVPRNASAGAFGLAFSSPTLSNQLLGASSLQQQQQQQQQQQHERRPHAGKTRGTWMAPSPSFSPAPSSSSIPSTEGQQRQQQQQLQQQQRKQQPLVLASADPSERSSSLACPTAPHVPTELQQQASKKGANGSADLPPQESSVTPNGGTDLPPQESSVTQNGSTELPPQVSSVTQNGSTELPPQVSSVTQNGSTELPPQASHSSPATPAAAAGLARGASAASANAAGASAAGRGAGSPSDASAKAAGTSAAGPSAASGSAAAANAASASAAGTAWRRPVPRHASASASRFAGGAGAASTSKPAAAAASGVSRRPGVPKQASSSAASKLWASPFGTAIMQRTSRGTVGDVAALIGGEDRAAGAAGSEGGPSPFRTATTATDGLPNGTAAAGSPSGTAAPGSPNGAGSPSGTAAAGTAGSPNGTADAATAGSPQPRPPCLQQSLCLPLPPGGAPTAEGGLLGSERSSPSSTRGGADVAQCTSPAGGAAATAVAAAAKFAEDPQGRTQQLRGLAAIPHSRSAGQVLSSEGGDHRADSGSGNPVQRGKRGRSSLRGGRAGRYSWEAVEGEEAAHGLTLANRPTRSAAQLGSPAGEGGRDAYRHADSRGSQRRKGSQSSKGSVRQGSPNEGQGLPNEGPGVGGHGSQSSLRGCSNSTLSLTDEESKQSVGTESRANTGGAPCSTSIDVWAVGVLTYVLLVGRHPFKRGSMQEIRNAVLAFKGRSSLDLPAHLSAEAASFITTCLHTSPLNRPPVVELLNHAWIKREKIAGSSTENG